MTVIDAPAPPTRRPMPADELDRLAHSRTAEWIDGEIVEKPVSDVSSRAEAWITTRLTVFTMATPVALVYPSSMGYRVFQQVFPDDPDRIRKPDVSVVRLDRHQRLTVVDPGYLPIVPDLAVEVLSPNDVWSDLAAKVNLYLSVGFPLVWIADPWFRTVMIHAAGADPILLSGRQTITAESALPGFACPVSDLFPPPLPTAAP